MERVLAMLGIRFHARPTRWINAILAVSLLTSATALSAETRRAEDVFAKWLKSQRIVRDVRLDRVSVNEATVGRLSALPAELKERLPFLRIPTAPAGSSARTPAQVEECRRAAARAVRQLEREPARFLRGFLKPPFSSEVANRADAAQEVTAVSRMYRLLFEALFGDSESAEDEETLVALANRLFEFAFGEPTHPEFLEALNTDAMFPAARLVFANIWYHLAGNGWRLWHENTLRALARESKRGREIVYIAGGSDIYHPILRGAAGMRVIDPMLPTQVRYYSEGWEFLIRGAGADGGVGDRILFGKDIVMTRVSFVPSGNFRIGVQELPASTTTWSVLYRKSGRAARFVLERRPVTQADFVGTSKRVFLISMNELYYVAGAESKNWGIDPGAFPSGVRILVKQLRRPIGKRVAVNLQKLRGARFAFIRLGSSVD